MSVNMLEQTKKLQEAVQAGQIIQERYDLEIAKLQEEMQNQLKNSEQSMMANMQEQASTITNDIITEKELAILMEDVDFKKNLVDVVQFYEQE